MLVFDVETYDLSKQFVVGCYIKDGQQQIVWDRELMHDVVLQALESGEQVVGHNILYDLWALDIEPKYQYKLFDTKIRMRGLGLKECEKKFELNVIEYSSRTVKGGGALAAEYCMNDVLSTKYLLNPELPNWLDYSDFDIYG